MGLYLSAMWGTEIRVLWILESQQPMGFEIGLAARFSNQGVRPCAANAVNLPRDLSPLVSWHGFEERPAHVCCHFILVIEAMSSQAHRRGPAPDSGTWCCIAR